MPSSIREALARETHFAEALSDTTRGIVVVVDPSGTIVHANPFLAELGGHASPDELIGKDWFALFSREPERDRELFARALAGDPVHRSRHSMLDRYGRAHEIEWTSRLLVDERGVTLGLLSIGIDVSEARAVHGLLERQQARFASVIAGTQDAFILIDQCARILAFNAAAERIFGYAAAEVLGEKVNVLMPEPYRTEHDGYIGHYEQTGDPRAIGRIRTVQGKRRSGEVFPIEVSVTKVGMQQDEARYAAFIRDISETVRLRERLLERERLVAIGTTSAKFAHEVGNPLNSMLMNLQLIQRRILKEIPSHELAPLVERVETEVRRLTSLLNDFRGMSRRQPYELRRVDPHALLAEFAEDHRPICESHGMELALEDGPGLPDVHVDRAKITQVLLNLVKNATEAMASGGKVTLRARQDGAYVVFEVSDTGPGIPAGVDVFQPFLTTKGDGTGLGLAVAQQIVVSHAGEIHFESKEGCGTTFYVRLPLDSPSSRSVIMNIVPS